MSEKTHGNDFMTKKDNITNKDKKAIKDDIIFFKEEILKHMNSLEKSFAEQKEEIRAKINGKFILYDETIEKLNTNFSELKKIVELNKYIKEQVDNWSHFKNDISKVSTGNNIKLTLLEKETYNNFHRIDKLLSNSIIYPRVIGENSKFKTFHEYIDYTLTHISSFDIFRSKIELDLKSYKEKVEKIIQMLKFKLDCSIRDSRQIVKNGVKENEVIIKDYIAGKIYALQEKNKEFEEKTEKNFDELNIGLNNFDEKMKFFNDKIEEKINLDKFNEEKESIINDINKCKNKNDELIKRINNLEKYNEIQEKKNYWANKTYKQRKKGDNKLNIFPGNNQGFDFIHNNNENYKNNGNFINNNKDLNLASIEEEKSKQINHGNDKLNKSKDNLNNSVDIYNNNRAKLNKISPDKNLLTIDGNTNTNESKKEKNNNQKGLKSNRSLYKLRISLKDINAQFNLNNLNDNNNINNINNIDKYKRENIIQTFPMTTKISNKIISFDEILSYSYKKHFKNLFEPRTTRFPLYVKNKEIKFLYDDNDIKNYKNNDILTEEVYYKNKNNKNDDHKKTWERLLSPKKKRKSELNILDTYLVNFRSLKKNKTLNKMHLSNSSKNFFSHFFKSDK